MPVGGKLVLKGGVTLKNLQGVEKKKKKKKAVAAEPTEQPEASTAEGEANAAEGEQGAVDASGKKIDPTAVNIMTGNTYEKEFEFETKRADEGKTRNTPWGSSYRAPPEILHGYDRIVMGVTAEERLDLRCAKKADKFCK